MSTSLSSARMAEEAAFAKRYLDALASHNITYHEDFVTPPEKRPRRMPVVGLDLGEVPGAATTADEDPSPSSDIINLTVKSLKPALTFSISASPSDSVAQLKTLVSASTTSAPPVSAQRLLVKGKALADNKLLQEYGLVDGATVHLILKTGWEKEVQPIATTSSTSVPSLTISVPVETSSEPSLSSATLPSRPLTAIDISVPPLGPQPQNISAAYHASLSDPAFWIKVHELCRASFRTENDADGCWQTFLEGQMAHLSAGEIARIQDVVGVTGMGGKCV